MDHLLPGTVPDSRPCGMVLCGQTALAGESLFCLPALAAEYAFPGAVAVSPKCHRRPAGALVLALADWPRTNYSGALLCRHTFTAARIHQRLLHAVLVCVRSLGLSFGPGIDYVRGRTAAPYRNQAGDASVVSVCCRGFVADPCGADLAAKLYVS